MNADPSAFKPGSRAAGGRVPPEADPAQMPELIAEDSALYSLFRGVAISSGADCFREMTRSLATALSVKYAIVAEFIPDAAAGPSARSLAFWAGDRFADNFEWVLAGTPCPGGVGGQVSHYPDGLPQAVPQD